MLLFSRSSFVAVPNLVCDVLARALADHKLAQGFNLQAAPDDALMMAHTNTTQQRHTTSSSVCMQGQVEVVSTARGQASNAPGPDLVGFVLKMHRACCDLQQLLLPAQ